MAETFRPGTSVSIVARRHDVNANQVFTWRRRFGNEVHNGEPSGFVPVVVPCDTSPSMTPDFGGATVAPAREAPSASATMAGRMEIELAGGRRVIVDKTVNAAALARVIGVLEGQ